MFHFVDHNSDDAVAGVFDQLQHSIVKVRTKCLVLKAIERRPSVHDLGSVKNYFPRAKDANLEHVESGSKALFLMLEAHNHSRAAEVPFIRVLGCLHARVANFVNDNVEPDGFDRAVREIWEYYTATLSRSSLTTLTETRKRMARARLR